MIEVKSFRRCDRCNEVMEEAIGGFSGVGGKPEPIFSAHLGDEKVEYVDLCPACQRVLGEMIKRAAKITRPWVRKNRKGQATSEPVPTAEVS